MTTKCHSDRCQRYKDRVTIVTGGARGIGFGIVKTFVQNGAKVVICDVKDDLGQKVQEEMNEDGPGECTFVKCDTSKEDEVKNLVETTVEKYGRLDCLINNAGVHPPHFTIDEFSAEDMTWLYSINTMGYFLSSKHALPHLRKTQGNIINNCSMVALVGQLGSVTYTSTKGAVYSMTKALAIDESKHFVRVNSFCPGNIETPLWYELANASGHYEKYMTEGRNCQLFGRMGTIDECGLVCLFLAADATFCTGININVSGGAELNYANKNRVDKS